MLKPLTVLLVIVTLLAIALNFDFVSENIQEPSPKHHSIEKEVENKISAKNEIEQAKKPVRKNDEHNLSKELKELLAKANRLFRESKDAEAHIIYDLVIEKSKNSKEVEILKLFAEACFSKATLYYIYPNYDIASAIELYDAIIDKFEKSCEKELIVLYAQAKMKQTQFGTKEENLVIYDEIIERLQNDPKQRFGKEIEELLFSKSFLLMGYDDEEAMEILDGIIDKYDKNQPLPDTVKYSIYNNIELAIITNNNTEEYIDLANKYMANSPDTKPLIEMLTIVQNACELPQDKEIEKWVEEHKDYRLTDWDFSELRKWVNKMEHPETQIRIVKYLEIFEQHKFQSYNQIPSVPLTPYPPSSDTEESIVQPTIEESTEDYGEVTYEPDPYQNDLYPQTEAQEIVYEDYNPYNPINYPDPYATTPISPYEEVNVD